MRKLNSDLGCTGLSESIHVKMPQNLVSRLNTHFISVEFHLGFQYCQSTHLWVSSINRVKSKDLVSYLVM